jgi:hypothetical protein
MPRRSEDYDDRDRPDDENYDDVSDIRRRSSPPINTYLAPAILVTLFCCLPFGIVAIINAAQVSSKISSGDYRGAEASANQAKTWCWVSFGCGLAVALIYALLIAAGGMNQGGFR